MDAKLVVDIAKDINKQPSDWWKNYRVLRDGVGFVASTPQDIWTAIAEGETVERNALVTRTITYPEPLSEPPEPGTLYYVLFGTWSYWKDSRFDRCVLEDGRVHLSKENRDAHELALRSKSNG